MDDRDVEALLARYRPADPDPEFESRLSFRLKAEATESSGRTWPWAVAAAALLAITIGLHAGVVAGSPPNETDSEMMRRTADLTEQLGAGADGRRVADWMIRQEAAPREIQAPPAPDALTAWERQ